MRTKTRKESKRSTTKTSTTKDLSPKDAVTVKGGRKSAGTSSEIVVVKPVDASSPTMMTS